MSRGSSVSSTASTALNGTPSRLLVRILIGHTSEKLPQKTLAGHTHKWTVFVRPISGELTDRRFIKKVTFNLHESFANPLRVVKEPPFQVSETGYGGFTLPIAVQFNGIQKIYTINYELSLSLDKYGEYSFEQKIELKNPSKELTQLVQKYCKKVKNNSVEILKHSELQNLSSSSKNLQFDKKHKSQLPLVSTPKEPSKIASKNLSNSISSSKEKVVSEFDLPSKSIKEDINKEKSKDLIKSSKTIVSSENIEKEKKESKELKIQKPSKIPDGKKLPVILKESEISNNEKSKESKEKEHKREKERDPERQRKREERRRREREEAQKTSEVDKKKPIESWSNNEPSSSSKTNYERKTENAQFYKAKLEAALFGETPSTSKAHQVDSSLKTENAHQTNIKANIDNPEKVRSYTAGSSKMEATLSKGNLEDNYKSNAKESAFASKTQLRETSSPKSLKNAVNPIKKVKREIKVPRIESRNGEISKNDAEKMPELSIEKVKKIKKRENLPENSQFYESTLKNETFLHIPQNSISPIFQMNAYDAPLKRPNSAISTSTSSLKTTSIPPTPYCGAESDNLNASEEQDDDVSTLIDEETNSITNKMEGIEEHGHYNCPPNMGTPMSHDKRLQHLVDQIQGITDPDLMYQITDILIETDSSILSYDNDGHIFFDMYKIKFDSILRIEKIFSSYNIHSFND